ncbi:Uncharacterised protein [Mycobacteroides abscessus subsp. abscessus]|nr:Uncharacterised protein [Mycobacteroides abscessus subsp. abscessus]
MIAAVDDHEVFDATGDVELAVEPDAVVAGAHPLCVCGRAVGVAALFERRVDGVVERRFALVSLVPVAGSDVESVQPDLADLAVGFLDGLSGLVVFSGVDDRGPLAQRDLSTRDLCDRVGCVLVDDLHVSGVEFVAVDVDDLGLVVALCRGDEQRGLGHAVAGLDRGLGQAVRTKCVVELLHRADGDGLGAVDQSDHVRQVEVLAVLG